MNVMDAAYNVVHDNPGGAAPLAVRLGKRPEVLRSEVAGAGTAKFGLVDALKVTLMTKDLRILHAYAEECGQMCVPLPELIDVEQDDVLQSLGEASREFGLMCQEICKDMVDGVITDNELDRIERERTDLIAMLHHLGEAIRARNLAGKPDFARGDR